ncbi:MAG TPA: MATE family efflux transporter [Devosia sp.]|nr:MATE family efflux transporter [Devosia sp.]
MSSSEKNRIAGNWGEEFRATLSLAWPLVVAQLAGIALNATDVIMMGWLGPSELAAGALANSIFFTLFLGGLGLVTATAPVIAQALGAGKGKSVRRTVRQGLWLAIGFAVFVTPFILNLGPVFLLLGQDPAVVVLAQEYLSTAVWMVFPGLGIVVMRALVSARGDSQVVLWVTVIGIFVNAIGNYTLMFGNFGAPRLELVGAGISTSIVHFVMFFTILGFVLLHRRYRRYHVLVRFFKPDWPRFFELLRIGTPISLTILSEVSLFGLASILMGILGTVELAAHAVALQLTSIAFMVPLGLSQATTVRVGLAYGAGDLKAIGRAGWVSMGVGMSFMVVSCAVFLLFPTFLVELYLDKTVAENQAALLLAASFLIVAAAFQLVDGAQVIMLASLRGLSDTRVPMVIAFIGYWGVGMGTAYVAGFVWEWRGIGIWLGLATGLAFAAVMLTLRFATREKLGLLKSLNN